MHFVGNESFHVQMKAPTDWEWVKLSSRVHLHYESKMAAGQSMDDFTGSVAAILDVDPEKTVGKSLNKIIKKD